MSKVAIQGNASGTGTFTIAAPNSNNNPTLSLPDVSSSQALVSVDGTQTLTGKTLTSPTLTSPTIGGTPTGVGVLTSGTAVASTSGTSIDFTGIPSWVKRITVMLSTVSTNGTSNKQIQLGTSGGVVTSGYLSSCSLIYGFQLCVVDSITSGFLLRSDQASEELNGHYVFTLLESNTWVGSTIFQSSSNTRVWTGAGKISLGGTLDRLRITTVNGTDTFDAGSINILYE